MRGRLIDHNFNYLNILLKLFGLKYCFNFKHQINLMKISVIDINYNIILNYKDLAVFRYKTLSDITAVNYPGLAKSLELNYYFWSYKLFSKYNLKYFLNKEDLVLSIMNIYSNANWLERELWDLYGIKFIYHHDLRRILTDYGFVGHPLLKLFPLTGFFELRYDDSLEKIVKEELELSQAYRFFNFFNPWTRLEFDNNNKC
jgi:NADH-quinone oxidoreductase subunit C